MTLRTLIILALLVLPTALAFAQTGDRAKYINYEYPGALPNATLPNGVTHLGGGLIGDIESDPLFEIADVKKGKTRMLWFNISTGQDSGGVTGWKVLDVLSFPHTLKSDYLFFTGDPSIECRRNGTTIPGLVGVGRVISRQGIFKPSKLWVANIATKKFEPQTLRGVKCEYSEP